MLSAFRCRVRRVGVERDHVQQQPSPAALICFHTPASLMSQEALIHENEVAQTLTGRGCLFEDPTFPASAESLYRTPQQPPAGALPAALAVWARISQQEVRRCHTPVTFPEGELEQE